MSEKRIKITTTKQLELLTQNLKKIGYQQVHQEGEDSIYGDSDRQSHDVLRFRSPKWGFLWTHVAVALFIVAALASLIFHLTPPLKYYVIALLPVPNALYAIYSYLMPKYVVLELNTESETDNYMYKFK